MNKTTDGRIIDRRVEINKQELKSIIVHIKENKNLTWKELANKLGVVEHTLKHDWINKNNTIPLSVFKKLLKMSDLSFSDFKNKIKIKSVFWGQRLGKKVKKVKLPDQNSKEFAEFYGIMLGDGCVNSDLKGFVITGDKILEKRYYEEYLSNLVNKLFGIKPKIIYSKNTRVIRLVIYSRTICDFLTSIGFPKGIKNKGKMKFPYFITKNEDNLSACLRGLMDTDGSLSSHPNSKIMIHLSITNKDLKMSALHGLNKFGIEAGTFNKGIMLYGEDKIKKFSNVIGFSNPKNILKYKKFIQTGRVPKSGEIETFLREK